MMEREPGKVADYLESAIDSLLEAVREAHQTKTPESVVDMYRVYRRLDVQEAVDIGLLETLEKDDLRRCIDSGLYKGSF